MLAWRDLRSDIDGQLGALTLMIAFVLILVGLFVISVGQWSTGFALIGVGLILGGWGGVVRVTTPWGQIVGGAGVIVLIAAFIVAQVFHR